jgi:hypothetical protein
MNSSDRTKPISELTEEIELIKKKWTATLTQTPDRAAQQKAVNILYERASLDSPKIIFVEGPLTAMKLIERNPIAFDLTSTSDDSPVRAEINKSVEHLFNQTEVATLTLFGSEYRESLGNAIRLQVFWIELGTLLDTLRLLLDNYSHGFNKHGLYLRTDLHWAKQKVAFLELDLLATNTKASPEYEEASFVAYHLTSIFPFKDVCLVCNNPHIIRNEEGRIHNDRGPAIIYRDGLRIWALEDRLVPESVVMHPELQTLDEINSEPNAELRRIRIDRFGWHRYLTERGAKLVDSCIVTTQSGITWMESLVGLPLMTVLCTYDPSTGKQFALEVDSSITTCKEAQRYLLDVVDSRAGLGLPKDITNIYPYLRT